MKCALRLLNQVANFYLDGNIGQIKPTIQKYESKQQTTLNSDQSNQMHQQK